MTTKPKRPPIRRLSPLVQRLPTQVQPTRSTSNPDSWRAGKTVAEMGYGSRWRRARLEFLAENPTCAMCAAEDRLSVATVVDHIRPHRGDQALFWSRSNWQPLCRDHHNRDKQRLDIAEAREREALLGAAGTGGEGRPSRRRS